MSKITQCNTSVSLTKFFDKPFREKWGLDEYYTDVNKPTIFFGVYNTEEYLRVINHKSLAVVVWGGSDSMALSPVISALNLPHIKHISGSKWITNDLEKAGIKPIYLPISCADNSKLQLKAQPLGECIYVYTAEGQGAYFYGKDYYQRLMEKYGTKIFYISTAHTYTRDQLYNTVLPNCFIGLRIVPHDGLSETVSELGLMGRRVIYNGCEPNALNYTSYEDIIEHIENERKYIGETHEFVAEKMRKFLEIGNEWLNTEYYENREKR